MNRNYTELPNGYLETIQRGINGIRRFQGGLTSGSLSRGRSHSQAENGN